MMMVMVVVALGRGSSNLLTCHASTLKAKCIFYEQTMIVSCCLSAL